MAPKKTQEGGRFSQEHIDYMIHRLARVKHLFNQCMTILTPFFEMPPETRNPDESLTDMERSIIQENDLIISDLMEKVHRKFRDVSRHNPAFRQSEFYKEIRNIQHLYFYIYREQWGGYQYYDDIDIEKYLIPFYHYINRVHILKNMT